MPFFAAYVHVRTPSRDTDRGATRIKTGFFTGYCIEAGSADDAKVVLVDRIMRRLASEKHVSVADFDPAHGAFDEFIEVPAFDDSYNIGRAFYEETSE